MVDFKDYYEILGVGRQADAKEIKRAYRRLARKFHPDVNPSDPAAEARFKEINEAHEVLGDAEKRAKYDRLGHEWRRHQQAGAQEGFDWGAWAPAGQARTTHTYATAEDLEELFGGTGFSDFFETLFGGQRTPQGPGPGPARSWRGRDAEHPVDITLAEAYHGTVRRLEKDGRRLEVSIPPGVRTGSKVRLAGEGLAGGAGGPHGDLYLVINVQADPRFERAGDDLRTTVEVPLSVAILGGTATVPTPAGPVQLDIPAETQNQTRFRLRGKGMPRLQQADIRGDLIATVNVRLPQGLTDDERQLFRQLRDLRAASQAQSREQEPG